MPTSDAEQSAQAPQYDTIFSQDDAFVTGGIFSDVAPSDVSPFSLGGLPAPGSAAVIPAVRRWGVTGGEDGGMIGESVAAGAISVRNFLDCLSICFEVRSVVFPAA